MNNKTRDARILIPLFLAPALCALPQAVLAQATQSEIARGLSSDDRTEVARAVVEARRVGADNLRTEVRRAALEALLREGRLAARFRAGAVDRYPQPELLVRPATLVAQFGGGARAAEGLAGALGMSPWVAHALAEYGETGARAVLEVAEGETHPGVLGDSFVALRFLVERHEMGQGNLSADVLDRIEAMTRRALDGEFGDSVLRPGIDLAVALGDPAGLAVVQQFADDRQVIEDRVSTTDRSLA